MPGMSSAPPSRPAHPAGCAPPRAHLDLTPVQGGALLPGPCAVCTLRSRVTPPAGLERLRGLWIDPGNLRALQAEPRHQPLLAEKERIDITLGCGRRKRSGFAGVHENDARAGTDLPAVALLEIVH